MKRFIFAIFAPLLIIAPVVAQDATPEPTPEPPPVVVIEQPDLTPIVDEVTDGLETFLASAGLVMAIVAFFVIQGLKALFPATVVSTRAIYLGVTGVFAVLYIGAALFNMQEQVSSGIDTLSALAGPLWQIILLVFGSPILYELAKNANVPILSDKQGEDAFSLEPHSGANAAG